MKLMWVKFYLLFKCFSLPGNINEFEDCTVDDIRSLSIGLIPNRHRRPVSVSNDCWIHSLTANLQSVRDPSNADIAYFLNSAAFSMENVMFEALGVRIANLLY